MEIFIMYLSMKDKHGQGKTVLLLKINDFALMRW